MQMGPAMNDHVVHVNNVTQSFRGVVVARWLHVRRPLQPRERVATKIFRRPDPRIIMLFGRIQP